jgi:hypothetical protein
MDITEEEFAAANERARTEQAAGPVAVGVEYEADSGRLVILLSSGEKIFVSPSAVRGLEQARPEDFAVAEISPSGFGIYFPMIDADLYLPALIEDAGTSGR